MLKVTNVSTFRKNIKEFIDGVADDQDTVIVNSNNKSVVVLSLEEYNKMDETEYLTSSEVNKRRLEDAVKHMKAGKGVKKNLIES